MGVSDGKNESGPRDIFPRDEASASVDFSSRSEMAFSSRREQALRTSPSSSCALEDNREQRAG